MIGSMISIPNSAQNAVMPSASIKFEFFDAYLLYCSSILAPLF